MMNVFGNGTLRAVVERVSGTRTTRKSPSSSSTQGNEPRLNTNSTMVAPVVLTNRSTTGAVSAPCPDFNEPYRKIITESTNGKRDEVEPVASTSGNGAEDRFVWRQVSEEPYVIIYEQPVTRKRFRYLSEVESAGSILGRGPGPRSYPKIKIGNYIGPVLISVILVTKDEPNNCRVHPNSLIGKKNSISDVYKIQVEVKRNKRVFDFQNLGILSVKNDVNQIKEALERKERKNIDPFNQGFSHKETPKEIDLHAVRLCFHVELIGQKRMLEPIVSDVIYNLKKICDLKIKMRCQCTGPVEGKTEIIILCSQVTKKNIQVVFYENECEEGKTPWSKAVEPQFHSSTAIVCESPAYRLAKIEEPAVVKVHLWRKSDNAQSNAVTFTYMPDPIDVTVSNKREKTTRLEVQDYIKQNWRPPVNESYDKNWLSNLTNILEPIQDLTTAPPPDPGNSTVQEPSYGYGDLAVPRPSLVESDITANQRNQDVEATEPDIEPMELDDMEPMSVGEVNTFIDVYLGPHNGF